ncbi:MAG: hypothetical protein QOG13_120 [Sphingomonadales bacterium]|jgi:hypothetical protein|nr:hypothetical protein [Sphingomonadales bacterium]
MRRALSALGLAVLLAVPDAALARCRVSERAATVTEAADFLLAAADIIGIATVSRAADAVARRPEVIDVLIPLKGEAGMVTMAPSWRGDGRLISSDARTLGVPPGNLALVALNRTPEGAVINQCVARMLAAHPAGPLTRALMARQAP